MMSRVDCELLMSAGGEKETTRGVRGRCGGINQCRRNMTASKKAVRTRRGVEPTGRPARREVERGRRARTNSSRTFAQRAGRPRSRAARPGGATIVAPAGVAMIGRICGIMGRRRRAIVVNQSSFETRHISNMAPSSGTSQSTVSWPAASALALNCGIAFVARRFDLGVRSGLSASGCFCDFFDSQRAFAPPGRVLAPHAAQEGSGVLGGRVLAGYYSLGTPDTRLSRGRRARPSHHQTLIYQGEANPSWQRVDKPPV